MQIKISRDNSPPASLSTSCTTTPSDKHASHLPASTGVRAVVMSPPRASGTAPWVTPWQREWLSASLGCAVADTIFNPLEVLKVRRQVAIGGGVVGVGNSIPHAPASTFSLARTAIAEKGIFRGLWHPGLEATIYRAFSYTGFRIGMYPTVRVGISGTKIFGDSDSFLVRVVAGATTGAVGSAVFNPIDVVRIRMQVSPAGSTLGVFSQIVKAEGIKGLWRGYGVCMLRAATLSGSQLATYDTVKRSLKDDTMFAHTGISTFREGPALHFAASLLSGIVAQTVTQPADTLKTLVMANNSSAVDVGKKSPNAVFVAYRLVSQNGLKSLYRGFWPAAARQGPVMVIQMPMVEQFRKMLGLEYF